MPNDGSVASTQILIINFYGASRTIKGQLL